MASPRLSEGQKQELVARYRDGESANALASAYGCSANTIARVVRLALDPDELASIRKQPRSRGAAAAAPIEPTAFPEPTASPEPT
ncbi:MAG: hypothetical protein WCF98_05615, partial [Synechococcus sp. ELA057]